MLEAIKNSKVVMVLIAMMFVATAFVASSNDAHAYRSSLCSGYGSVYHTHTATGGLKYYMYTYSDYSSGGYIYDEYWNWSSPYGWQYKGWDWC